MNTRLKKRFDLNVTAEGQGVSETFELDKTVTAIKGLLICSNRDDLLFFRGSQKIEINKQELFPEGYESKLLMCGINVTPHGRYYDLGDFKPGNGIIKVDYKDTPDPRTTFAAYRVSLYVDCITAD